MEELKQNINVVKSSDYRVIFVTGIYGGSRHGYIEMTVLSDVGQIGPHMAEQATQQIPIERVAQCTLMIPIAEAKSIIPWLVNNVKNYEENFGEVKIPVQPTQSYHQPAHRTQ